MIVMFLMIFSIVQSKPLCLNNKFSNTKNYSDKNSDSYTVYKIDSINTWYLIYAKRNDSLYKIVSKKENSENCNRIKINSKYYFKLVSWFPSNAPQNLNISTKNIPHLAGYGFDDSTTIMLEKGLINDLMYGENIKGLCFIKE